ncbi:MAG: tetratricopeptide 2 repeat protein [Schlesneria sp.]|nr:tetratricopeptide 2 repeat protein [Schlesneria sp.]
MSHPMLGHISPNEIVLLEILAWFAPDPIPRVLFDTERAEEIWQEAVGKESPATALRETLNSLVRLDLVIAISEVDSIAIHEVIQQEARDRQVLQSRRLGFTLRFLNEAVNSDVKVDWGLLRPHILISTSKADQYEIFEPTSVLMSALADWLIGASQWVEGESLQRRALQIDSKNFGPYSTRAARDLSRLALTLHATARPFEARLLMRRALAIEQCYGPDNPGITDRFVELASISKYQDTPVAKSTESSAEHSPTASDEYETEMANHVEIEFALASRSLDSGILIFGDTHLASSSPIEGVPRFGRIMFVTRCIKRMEWSPDCVPEMSDRIRSLVSQSLAALNSIVTSSSRSHFPPRSALHECMRSCIRYKRSASRQMQFDLTVAIENLLKFLTAMDYAIGTARALDPHTSLRFTELTAAVSAVTKRHRKAQRTDVLALRGASEGHGWAEDATVDAEILGPLWE